MMIIDSFAIVKRWVHLSRCMNGAKPGELLGKELSHVA